MARPRVALAALSAAAALWSAANLASAAPGLTLEEYYAAALQQSAVVATQAELIRQAEERYKQAGAALKPTLSGVAAYTRLDPVPNEPSRTSQTKLTATQPLFRGFAEFAALRQNRALIGAQNEDYANARVRLFRDVTDNFYNVLSIEQDVRNIEAQIGQSLERQKELNDRVRIGRSRVSEVLNVQTTIATLRAQIQELQGQLQTAREAFAFLSGLDAATPLRDTEPLPGRLEPLADYLARIELRPDIKAAQQRITAAQENISAARGAYYPSIDLNGNYYLDRTGETKDKDVDWDVQLALTLPLYAGGVRQSRVREAASQRAQAELAANQTSRQAEQEIRALYQGVVFNQSQVEALAAATDTARRNYEIQAREYRLGLVTNLDVLQALTAYQENQRALDRARYAAKLNYITLQAAALKRPDLREGAVP